MRVGLLMAATLTLAACGGGHRLAEYDFGGRTVGAVYYAPSNPDLNTGGYGVDAETPVGVAVQAGSRVAKELEARRARSRLDSASARVDLAGRMTGRTLERGSRYLGARPLDDARSADFLLEIDIHSYGIDARGERATLFVTAEALLLDRARGTEIWRTDVRAWDRLTPAVAGAHGAAGDITTAGMLRTLTVDDFERVLTRLADFTADVVARELREDIRKAR